MSVQENKKAVRLIFEEVMNKGNIALVDEIIAANYVYHSPFGMDAKGPDGFKEMVNMFRTAFPDLAITIEALVAEGDKVACFSTIRGTHTGDMMGMPPTGRRISVASSVLVRFAGGKEVEANGVMDTLAYNQQLGLVPSSEGTR